MYRASVFTKSGNVICLAVEEAKITFVGGKIVAYQFKNSDRAIFVNIEDIEAIVTEQMNKFDATPKEDESNADSNEA